MITLEKETNMQEHTLELSQTLIPDFHVDVSKPENGPELTAFELSMLCGMMVHPMAKFRLDSDGKALSMEWAQEFPL